MGGGRVGGEGGGSVGFGGQGGCERKSFCENSKEKNLRGGGGGSDQGLGWERLGSKVRGRWVMWGMGDVNQE